MNINKGPSAWNSNLKKFQLRQYFAIGLTSKMTHLILKTTISDARE
jgi:hypothetical protein